MQTEILTKEFWAWGWGSKSYPHKPHAGCGLGLLLCEKIDKSTMDRGPRGADRLLFWYDEVGPLSSIRLGPAPTHSLGDPPESRKTAPWSLKRVQNESESQVLESFRTLLRLQGALFPGSFRALPEFRAQRAGRPCAWQGRC